METVNQQNRGETKEILTTDELGQVNEPVVTVDDEPEIKPMTEEEIEALAVQDAEVESILASLGLADFEEDEAQVAIDSDFYAEEMNVVNEIRQTAGVISNRLMMAVLGEFKLELKEVGIDHDALSPEVYNRTFITYAQKFFDENLAKFAESTEGSEGTREAFEHAVTILSHVVGFTIPNEYVRFDLITVQVLHVMQKQFHDSMVKQNMAVSEEEAAAATESDQHVSPSNVKEAVTVSAE